MTELAVNSIHLMEGTCNDGAVREFHPFPQNKRVMQHTAGEKRMSAHPDHGYLRYK